MTGLGSKQYVTSVYFCSILAEADILKDEISKDEENHGAMFVPIILGSDKTTVSVATGHNEYYPLYASVGVVHNSLRRTHSGAVVLIGYLVVAKSECYVFN